MALLTIVEASKQFKISRSRIYKKINEGELSTQLNETGAKVIQYVDLVRIFGENSTNPLRTMRDIDYINTNNQGTRDDNYKHVYEDKKVQHLNTSEDMIILLKEQVNELKKDKAEMARRLDDMSSKHDRLLLLIEHKPLSAENGEDNKKTGFMLMTLGVFIIILLITLITLLSFRFFNIN